MVLGERKIALESHKDFFYNLQHKSLQNKKLFYPVFLSTNTAVRYPTSNTLLASFCIYKIPC